MVYGKDFIWLHLGKTGGTTTNYLFSQCLELVEYYDLDTDPKKHENIAFHSRRFPDIDFTQKKIILGFRKIETWIVSHNNHFSHFIDESRIAELSQSGRVYSGPAGESKSPDQWLESYLQKPIDHFIRAEHLSEDFLTVMRNYGLIDDHKIKNCKRNRGDYKKSFSYTKKQLQKIYEDNPLWMGIQNRIYD